MQANRRSAPQIEVPVALSGDGLEQTAAKPGRETSAEDSARQQGPRRRVVQCPLAVASSLLRASAAERPSAAT